MTKVAAYQAPLLSSGSMEAIGLIAAQVRACESIGVEFLCCPEGVLGGLADDASQPHAIAINVRNGELQRALAPIASKTVTTIIGLTEIDNGRLFNAAAVLHNGAVIGLYRKLHPAISRSIYEPGHDTPVFTVGELTFGIVICRDSTFSEPARVMANRGATALFVPTNNGLPPAKGGAEIVEYARETDIIRAKENRVSVIRADVAGRADGLVSYGSSGIVDRDGIVLSAAKPLEVGLVVAEIGTVSCEDVAEGSGSITMNPFVGTWIANLEKSRRHANHQFHSATLTFEVNGDEVSMTHAGVNMSGKKESGTTVLKADGQPYAVSPLAPGVVAETTWVSTHVLESEAKKDGRPVGKGTYAVSADGRTLTATVAGTDAAGAPFEQVIVFDRE